MILTWLGIFVRSRRWTWNCLSPWILWNNDKRKWKEKRKKKKFSTLVFFSFFLFIFVLLIPSTVRLFFIRNVSGFSFLSYNNLLEMCIMCSDMIFGSLDIRLHWRPILWYTPLKRHVPYAILGMHQSGVIMTWNGG